MELILRWMVWEKDVNYDFGHTKYTGCAGLQELTTTLHRAQRIMIFVVHFVMVLLAPFVCSLKWPGSCEK